MSNADKLKLWQEMYEGTKLCEGCGHMDVYHGACCPLAYKMHAAWTYYPSKCRELLAS